ncbi:MAG: tetratricopeptide repeat protein [Anaerolineae bacterium]|nr:tetratricopeptide repeat protein [Anaerolineae bacterium]
MRLWRCLVASVILGGMWLAGAPAATAQDVGTIAVGETVEARLELGKTASWTLTSDVAIHVHIDARSDEFDTRLAVLDEDGTRLRYNDDWHEDTDAHVGLAVEPGRTYTIVVSSYANAETGAYQLSVQPSRIRIGETVDDYKWRDHAVTWSLDPVDAPTTINVDVTSDEFDTLLTVYDGSGAQVAQNDDRPGDTDSLVADLLLAPGEIYKIEVGSYEALREGEYELRVWEAGGSLPTKETETVEPLTLPASQETSETAAVPTAEVEVEMPAGAVLTLGAPASDAIQAGGSETWVLVVDAPVTVTIDAQSDEFDTFLELYGPAGRRIRYIDDYWKDGRTDARLAGVPLLAGQPYQVVVKNSPDNYSGGAYQLSASVAQIGLSETVEGMLRYEVVNWQIEVDQLTVVTIDLRSADFDAQLTVYDANGNQVAFNDDWEGSLSSHVENVELRSGGPYTITASSVQNSGEGMYTLMVTPQAGGSEALPTDLTLGGEIIDTLAVGRPVSWTFAVDESAPVTFDLRADAFDAVLTVYDAAGNPVGSSDNWGGATDARLATTGALLPGERYDIVVSSPGNTGSGEYRLSAFYTSEAAYSAELWLAQGFSLVESGDYGAALERFARAVDAFAGGGDLYGEAAAAFWLGLMNQELGRYEGGALDAYQRALAIQRQTYGRRGEGRTLEQLGRVYHAQGDYTKALEQYWEAWDIASNQVKDRAWTGRILYDIGAAYHAMRQYDEAANHYAQALAFAQAEGDAPGEGDALDGLGRLYQEQTKFTLALDYLLPALDIRRTLSDRAGEGTLMQTVAWTYMGLWKYQTALGYFEGALAAHREVNSGAEEARALEGIGDIYRYTGQYDLALTRLEQARDIYIALGDLVGASRALGGIGCVHDKLGRYTDALSYFNQALDNQVAAGDRQGELNTLNYIGAVYTAQGQYSDAFDLHDKAYLIAYELGDQRGMASSLYYTGEVFRGLGQAIRALDLYWEALEIQRAVNDREGERITYIGLGWALDDQKDPDALSYLRQAGLSSLEMEDRRGQGIALLHVGDYYVAHGDYEDALISYQEAETILRETGDRRGLGMGYSSIGRAYVETQEYGKASDRLLSALDIHREAGDVVWETQTLIRLGALYDAQEEFGAALGYYQQALNLGKQMGELTTQIDIYNRIGRVYYHTTEYDKALNNHQQARDIAMQINDLPGLAASYEFIGNVFERQERTDEAQNFYQLAQAIHEQLRNRLQEGRLKAQVAALYQPGAGQPWQYGWAMHLYWETLEIHRSLGNKLGEAITLNKMGVVYRLQGDYEKAEQHHLDALAIIQQAGDRLEEVRILHSLGALYEAWRRPVDAVAYYAQAVDLIEAIHADIGFQSGQRTFGSQDISVIPYDRLVALLFDSEPARAFEYAERGRARTFLFRLEQDNLTVEQVSDAALLEQWQAGRDAILDLEAGRTELFFKRRGASEDVIKEIDAQIAGINEQLKAAELELSQISDSIEAQNPDLNQLTRVDVPDLETVQAALPDGAALLSYYLTDEDVYAFVLTRTDLRAKRLAAKPGDLRNEVSAFRVDQTQTGPLQKLYALLVAPLEDSLPPADPLDPPGLIVVPHDVLNFVSFASLTANGSDFLVDRYAVSYSPSATVYTVLAGRGAAEAAGQALVLGNPDYSLPFATDEAEEVAAILGVLPVLGGDATESLLRAQIGSAGVVHMAAHGKFDAQDPLSSALKLAGDAENDGLLEVREVYALPLREHGPLVVLSACETAVGALTEGDEFQGLTRAFLLSGARTVVASLWTVDDAATAALMAAFYRNRAGGMNEAAALAAAQRSVRQDAANSWTAPDYWAGFVLVGVPD